MAAIMPCYEFVEYRRRFIEALRALAERVADRSQAAYARELANRLDASGEVLGGDRRESPEDHAVIFWAASVRFRASQRFRYWMACDSLDTRIPRGEGESVAALVQQHAKLTTGWMLAKINEYRVEARAQSAREGTFFICYPETQDYTKMQL